MSEEKETRKITDESIVNDNSLRTYKVLNGDKVVAYFEREATPMDKPARIERAEIVEPPHYFGEWVDKTEEYIKAHEKEAKHKKREPVFPSDLKAARDEELRKAQEQLARLLAEQEKKYGGREHE